MGNNSCLTATYPLKQVLFLSGFQRFACGYRIKKIIMLDVSSMERYVSPINPAVFPHLTVVLMGIGIFFMAWFFVYEVTSSKFARDLVKELVVSAVASAFMGFGVLFLL